MVRVMRLGCWPQPRLVRSVLSQRSSLALVVVEGCVMPKVSNARWTASEIAIEVTPSNRPPSRAGHVM